MATAVPTIRRATLRDLPAIRTMWHSLWDEMEASGVPRHFAPEDLDTLTTDVALALPSPTTYIFLAEDAQGEPCAMIVGEEQTNRLSSPRAIMYVAAIWCRPDLRRTRITPRLVATLIESAPTSIEACEYVSVPGLDTPATHWFRDSLGFVPVETRYLTTRARVTHGLRIAMRADVYADEEPAPVPLDKAEGA